jgi:ankyrin repeat protein
LESALHKAALKGNIQIAELLIDKFAHLDIPSKAGYTPLHHAARFDVREANYLKKGVAMIVRTFI